MALFLVRYGEIGLKSDSVRRRFEKILRFNIEDAFVREQAECRLRADRGHLYVHAEDARTAKTILRRTFGVTSFSKVEEIETDLDDICSFVAKRSRKWMGPGQTFAIRSRRTGNHRFTSQDVAVRAGDAVREAHDDKVKVNLDGPDVEIFIEVRMKRTYIYTGRVEGPGGMPLGSQGRIVALVKDGDSALACWLLMKRGCHPYIIPVGKKSGGRWKGAVAVLDRWSPKGKFTKGPALAKMNEKAIDEARIFARKRRAHAVVVGERKRLLKKRDFPIFYPLIGLSDKMLEDYKKKMRS
jgi:thiamine biosynthesis protein ThiI